MKRTRSSSPAFEALEARLLLSGNPSPAGVVGALKGASETVVAGAGVSVALKAKGVEVGNANAACNAVSGPVCPVAQGAGKGNSWKVPAWEQARPVWFSRSGTAFGCGAINPAGDVDTQTFIAPKSGALTIELSGLGRHSTLAGQVSVYDAKGNLLAKAAGTARASAVTTVDVVKGQRYYVRVSGVGNAKGAYVVRYRFAEARPDRAPVAGDDLYSLDEDGALAAASVLANDTDPEGQALAATLVAGVAHGALTLKPDGSFLYTPDADFNGTDFFTYTASDGKNLSNPATVTLNVRPVNDAPVAQDDLFEVTQNNTLTLPVLANDGDKDGDPLSAALASGASHGVVEYDNDGSIKYTPAPNFTGVDSFTYRAFDGQAYSDPVTVTINVVPLKIAQDDAYTMTAGTVLTVEQPGVLANDLVSTGWAMAHLDTGPQHGTLQNFDLFGGFTYIPTAGFTGADTFTYTVNEGTQYSNIATVTISVNPAGQAVA
ncbi:MAG: tandem-95 repeat protein [Planctomycetes bacterium]|nr:tandem-95 repeat protein [Planctomycetota bacterium]